MTPAERIAALEAELAAVRAEMQDFTYTVSHDLRAPLRHITSYVQLVQEDAGHLLPEEVQGFLSVISDSAQHLGALMDGLLELSRLGTAPLELRDVPLQDALHAALDELNNHYPQSVPHIQFAPDLPWVHADDGLLRKALQEVLDNALKFSANRSDALIAVQAQSNTPAGTVTLQVRDNGAGFNPALQDRLFKPFQRLHTTKQFAGTGMGLALTRKMLDRMGGSVAIDGSVGQGCTVTLTLPAAQAAT